MTGKMDKRLPITEKTHNRMTRFRDGLGMTYDDAVNLLLDIAAGIGDEFDTGARYSYEIKTGKRARPSNQTDQEGD
jgi:phage baseplate assembly protein gpV